jgi:hypothetical protein
LADLHAHDVHIDREQDALAHRIDMSSFTMWVRFL